MLKRLVKLFRDKGLTKEAINLITGFLMFVALFVYALTQSKAALYAAVMLGAVINMMTGFGYYKTRERRTLGMSMIMLGALIMILLAVFTAYGII